MNRPQNQVMSKLLKLVIVNSLVFMISIEVGLCIYFSIKNKTFTPANELYGPPNKNNTFVKKDCDWGERLSLHPYVGTFYGIKDTCQETKRNTEGFKGLRDFPQQAEKQYYTILLLGGSVAEQLAVLSTKELESVNYLEQQLNLKWQSPNKKPFRILSAAMGGGVQPTQFINSYIHLSKVDHVISVEGFNEHWKLAGSSELEAAPAHWVQLAYAADDPIKYSLIRLLKKQISKARESGSSFSYSAYATYFALSEWLNNSFLNYMDQYLKNLRVSKNLNRDAIKKQLLSSYGRYLMYINTLTKAEGKKFTLFVQPTAYAFKPLAESEQKIIKNYTKFDLENFKLIESYLLSLNKKIEVESLLKIFSGETQNIYVDLVHLNTTGTMIMADAIVEKIGQRYNWKKLSKSSL